MAVIEHDIAELDKQCACGCLKQRIGEEVTEQLEVIPAQLKVIQHVRFKYACNRCDEGVSIAPMFTEKHGNTQLGCLYHYQQIPRPSAALSTRENLAPHGH